MRFSLDESIEIWSVERKRGWHNIVQTIQWFLQSELRVSCLLVMAFVLTMVLEILLRLYTIGPAEDWNFFVAGIIFIFLYSANSLTWFLFSFLLFKFFKLGQASARLRFYDLLFFGLFAGLAVISVINTRPGLKQSIPFSCLRLTLLGAASTFYALFLFRICKKLLMTEDNAPSPLYTNIYQAHSIDQENSQDPPAYWKTKSLFPPSLSLPTADDLVLSMQQLIDHFSPDVYEVLEVKRIENSTLWMKYSAERQTILGRGTCIPEESLCDMDSFFHPFDLHKEINEKILFHGTGCSMFRKIINEGFDARMSSFEGKYGTGCYFTDHFSKADKYTDRDSSGRKHLLLARVLLGSVYTTNTFITRLRRPPQNVVTGYPNDSVCGTAERFKEFVVYANDQCYPELLIVYRNIRPQSMSLTSKIGNLMKRDDE